MTARCRLLPQQKPTTQMDRSIVSYNPVSSKILSSSLDHHVTLGVAGPQHMGPSSLSHYLLNITGVGIPVITITTALDPIMDHPLVLYLPHPVKPNTPPGCPSSPYSPCSSRSRLLTLDPALAGQSRAKPPRTPRQYTISMYISPVLYSTGAFITAARPAL